MAEVKLRNGEADFCWFYRKPRVAKAQTNEPVEFPVYNSVVYSLLLMI